MSDPKEPQDPYGRPSGDQSGAGPQPPAYGGSSGRPGAGGMGDGYSAPPPPPGYYGGGVDGPQFPATEKNQLGVWALVCGILGLVCCSPAAIPAIILGTMSKKAAAAGLANNGGLGTTGIVLGWIGVVLAVLTLIWLFLLGGLELLIELGEV